MEEKEPALFELSIPPESLFSIALPRKSLVIAELVPESSPDPGDFILTGVPGLDYREKNEKNSVIEITRTSLLSQNSYPEVEDLSTYIIKENSISSRSTQQLIKAGTSRHMISLPLAKIFNSGPNLLPNAFGQRSSLDITTRLEAKHLPEMALPIIDFMKRVQPDIVIGCDRGGRLFSLAIKSAWDTTEDERFPTIDNKVHFARVSKSEDFNLMQERIDEIVESTKKTAAQRGESLPDDWEPKIMFVDDWVVNGGTRRLAEKLVEKHKATPYFVVMTGDGADASGDHSRYAGNVAWHDRPEEIGVNYISDVRQNTDGTMTEHKKAVVVKTAQARDNRTIIKKAARLLGRQPTGEPKFEKVLEEFMVDDAFILKGLEKFLATA